MKKRMSEFIVTVLTLSCCIGSAADNSTQVVQERWSVSQILARAAETSPSLQAMQRDVLAAESRAKQLGRWENPQVSTTVGQTSVGSERGSAFQVSIQQAIPLFGQKSALENFAREEKLVIEAQGRTQSLVIEHLVARQAYRLAAIQEQMQHTSHRREKLLLIEGYLKSRPFASPSQMAEKALIQNRLREIEEQFIRVTADREREWQSLNVFLNLDSPILPQIVWATNLVSPDKKTLQARVEKENPDIVRQAQAVRASESEINLAGKKAYPDISIGGGLSDQAADQTRSYFGTLQVSLPILDGGGNGVEAARAKREAESFRLEHRRREAAAQFEQSWSELTESKKRIELFPMSIIPKLESQMQRTELGWRKGLVPVSVFLELESQIHDQILRSFEAQTSYVDALSELFLLSGQGFPREGK